MSLAGRVWHRVTTLRAWFDTPTGRRISSAISFGLSVLILLLLARAVALLGWPALIAVLPATPLAATLFWLCFAGQYLAQPIADWLLYRPWWRLAPADMPIFLKKYALNESLFAYAGEAALIAWIARRHMIASTDAPPSIAGRGSGPGTPPGQNPFADIKDAAITSGLAGNLFTLLMLLLAISMGAGAVLGDQLDADLLKQGGIGFGLLVGLNIVILFNRDRLFTLPVRANLRSFAIHMARVCTSHALLVASWAVALPLIGFRAWLLLGALRLVIARLPLPNKQLLFAAAAVSFAGSSAPAVAALMAAQGVLTLAAHALSWLAAELVESRHRN